MKEIAITSPSNVLINYQIASLSERSLAFIIDLVAVYFSISLLSGVLLAMAERILGSDNFLTLFFRVALPVFGLFTYFAVAEFKFEGTTLGKRALKLRTVRLDGSPASFETFALRSVMLLIDFLLSSGTVGLLAASSSPLRQRVGDRVAQTVVIKSKPHNLYNLSDILSIKTVEDHEVLYPAVVNLTNEQALLIKELLVKYERNQSKAHRNLMLELTARIQNLIGVEERIPNSVVFLRQVLRDYIVLTR